MANRSVIRIEEVRTEYRDYTYRTPIKFGGIALDRVTLLNVDLVVSSPDGRRMSGFGSMPLGNVWSFPSRALTYDQTLTAMKQVAQRMADIVRKCPDSGHPIDLTWEMESSFFLAAEHVGQQLQLPEPIPRLCTLVTASPFDAALHDAYGKLHNRSAYDTYSSNYLPHDLSHYLGSEFAGEHLDRYVLTQPRPRLPLYHLVGALDPLEKSDVAAPVGDGLPETLEAWIDYNGLTHLKIKLNGSELAWDIDRVLRVDRVAQPAQQARGVDKWWYSLDFNERCPNVEYLLEFIHHIMEKNSAAFSRVQYIEQPTARDLKAHPDQRVHEASKLLPVVIDESLLDLESLLLALDMGYTGVALKACKGQTQSLLMAAAAQKYGMFLCVQDLTCPGASFIHSAGLAAHVPGVAAIEGNARQYVPIANKEWEDRFPGLFRIKSGMVETGILTGPGLGAMAGSVT
jgi:L-alanine-DL-glutamate epimerase-like enolase superfamily enzyme